MRVVDQNIDLFPPPRDENPAFLTRARKRPRPIYYRPGFAYFSASNKQATTRNGFETCPSTSHRTPRHYAVQVVLAPYDRVAIGGELLLFKWKQLETPDAGPIPTAEEAVMEFKRAIQVK